MYSFLLSCLATNANSFIFVYPVQSATSAMNPNTHSIEQIYFARDKPARYRLLKRLHPDTIVNLFRVLNNANGGGADSLPAPFKGVFRYWCFWRQLPDCFKPAKPLECLQLQNFALAANQTQTQAVVRDFDTGNPWA